MKNVFYLLVSLCVLVSCNKENKYVTFSGKVVNPITDSLVIFHPQREFTKVIKLNEDGSFKDTIAVENGLFTMSNSKDFSLLYLINGDEITMNFDTNKFHETLNFSGSHAAENNFLATSLKKEVEFFTTPNLMQLPKETFDAKVADYMTDFNDRLAKVELDKDFTGHQQKELINFKNYVEKDYLEKNYNKLFLAKGMESPTFNNYENFKGGTSSLNDFKGMYVYIDLWATWCNPCKMQIPYLQKIEKQFHNKNIAFVSISLDAKKDYDVWRDLITSKNMGGVQLYAKGDKTFPTAYRVRTIPRFVLIDPSGNIVEADAPAPSEPQLLTLLNSLPL